MLNLGCHGQVSGTDIISTKKGLARLLKVVVDTLQLLVKCILLLVLVSARLAGQELNELGWEKLLASAMYGNGFQAHHALTTIVVMK